MQGAVARFITSSSPKHKPTGPDSSPCRQPTVG